MAKKAQLDFGDSLVRVLIDRHPMVFVGADCIPQNHWGKNANGLPRSADDVTEALRRLNPDIRTEVQQKGLFNLQDKLRAFKENERKVRATTAESGEEAAA